MKMGGFPSTLKEQQISKRKENLPEAASAYQKRKPSLRNSAHSF